MDAAPMTPSLRNAETYWDTAAETYEQDFTGTLVGEARRRSVWIELVRHFKPGQRVLEINCGTGIDALFLARRGVHVHACDLSPRMIQMAQERASSERLACPPTFNVVPTEHLASLTSMVPFDGAFSNFSGLNCVDDLASVGKNLGRLLIPGSPLLLCMMGRFVPLEILWFLAHGVPRKAFRRLAPPRDVDPGNAGLTIRRPSVTEICRSMSPAFKLLDRKGIGIVIPPSYAEHAVVPFPRLLTCLERIDRRIGPNRLFRSMADCVLLHFERKP
jgi:SAM-dependent methyltransferase